MTADTMLIVLLRKDDPEPTHAWLPPDYPSRCFESEEQFRLQVPGNVPYMRMTEAARDALQYRPDMREAYLLARHAIGLDAKDPVQVKLALANMSSAETDELNDEALRVAVSKNLDVSAGDGRSQAVFAAYENMQREKRGEKQPLPLFEDIVAQNGELIAKNAALDKRVNDLESRLARLEAGAGAHVVR